MKYAIIQCSNGTYKVISEGIAQLSSAKAQFHDRCKILWNAPDVVTATVKIVDENLDCVEGCRDFITHPVEETNESEQGA